MLPNGLELCEAALWASCPVTQALPQSLYGNSTGNASSSFPDASRVSCSEVLGGDTLDVACNRRSSALG